MRLLAGVLGGILLLGLVAYLGPWRADDVSFLQAPKPIEIESVESAQEDRNKTPLSPRESKKAEQVPNEAQTFKDSSTRAENFSKITQLTAEIGLATTAPAELQNLLDQLSIQAHFKRAGHHRTGERLELDVYPVEHDIIELHAVYDIVNEKTEFSSMRYRLKVDQSGFEGLIQQMAHDLGNEVRMVQRDKNLARWRFLSSDKVIVMRHEPPGAVFVLLEYAHEHQ